MDVGKKIIKLGNLDNQLEMLKKMDELAVQSVKGTYNITSMRVGLDELIANTAAMMEKMDGIAVQSANGTYNATTMNVRLDRLEALVGDMYEAVVTKK